jgi:hypothetical protein
MDVVTALNAIRQAVDLAGNVEWFVVHNVGAVLAALEAFVFSTTNPVVPGAPFTTVAPIRSFTPLAQGAADAALTAVVTYAGYRMMWGRTTTRSQFVLRVIVPRLMLAALLINFSVPLVQAAVDFTNALSASVTVATGAQVLADASEFTIVGPLAGLQGVVMLVLFASYAVLGFAYVVRFALLVILTILAPIAALLLVLPETRRYANEWVSLFVPTLLMQPLQLLILAIGLALDGASDIPVRHVFALASVFITFKVPGALHASTMAGSKASGFARRHIVHAVRAVTKA